MSASFFIELNAGDSSRASHVWRADGPDTSEIYRRAWWSTPEVSAFMLGLNRLFGVDPRDLQDTADTYRFWQNLQVWKVPEPLGFTEFQGHQVLRMEFIEGEPSREFIDVDASELGQQIAQVHQHRAACFGDVLGRQQTPLSDFYAHAFEMVREAVPKYQPENWQPHWHEAERIFKAAPAPTAAVPMLLDWSESQFVWRAGEPFALVDVEASALAPVELDLCYWELLLQTPQQAQAFRIGYTAVRPFPHLAAHRAACRLILLALESEGSSPLPGWLAFPAHFDTAGGFR